MAFEYEEKCPECESEEIPCNCCEWCEMYPCECEEFEF